MSIFPVNRSGDWCYFAPAKGQFSPTHGTIRYAYSAMD